MSETGLMTSGRATVPRNKYLALVALVVLLLSVVELTDVFELPFEAKVATAVGSGSVFSSNVLTSVLGIGYAGLFILMALESAALPIPSEVVLPLAGYAAYLGKMNLELAIVVATAAGVVGALVDYYLALFVGRPILYALMGRVGVSKARLDDGERWVDSRGSWSVLVARFIPGLRSIISIPAGLLKMNVKIFVALTAIGSFGWSAILIYLGYRAGPLWQSAMGSLSAVAGQIFLVAVAALSLVYVVYYFGFFKR
jgi:membrane protein DedA with SNARE-associated domain